ncbi:MAG: RNA polymerase factor sigma-54 [Deferribacteraceae bacterium]|jgi:RNA polymerase sigma-54 factor|nr:RNA polymerase factor sigma-54 [Deferribacteraceae bacterium]
MSEPNLNLGLKNQLSTTLLITPQMKQSLSLLQMPITELAVELSNYLETNPALESDDFDMDIELEDAQDEHIEETLLETLTSPEWDNYIEDGNSNELAFTPQPSDDDPDFEDYVSAGVTLSEHLLQQLKAESLTDKQFEIGEMIIGCLSETGYFQDNPAEIAELCSCTEKEVLEVLCIIKTFDPAGIASVSLVECILAQLYELEIPKERYNQIETVLLNCSKELENQRFDEITRKTGIDRQGIREILETIGRIDPHPGMKFSSNSNRYIAPDAYVVRNGDNFDVRLNEAGLPTMRLNAFYLRSLSSSDLDEDARKYMTDKLKDAVWILNSLHKRQKAIYKVAKAIVDVQKDYLMGGEEYFKPLRLKDIADITELHESTVSRVTAGKYILTDQGLLELKSFFSKKLDTTEGDTSSRSVKTQIRSLLDSEPPNNPFSDEKITQILNNIGIDIARRTVAKYREAMGIPKMAQRKRLNRNR